MTEATTSVSWELCEAVVRALTFSCDLMPLKDIVLQIIDRVGGKRESVYGQKVATQCFCYGLLELKRSDGRKVQFSKTDGEHPIICAASINPAEAVWIEPHEDGPHFVRRPATPPAPPAEPPQSSTTAPPPADRLPAAGGADPSQSQQPQQVSSATESDESAADPAPSSVPAAEGLAETGSGVLPARSGAAPIPTERASTTATAKRKKEAQLEIAKAAKKIWSPKGIVPLDFGPAKLMHAIEDLYKREAAAKDPKEKPRDRPAWSSCKRFLEDQRST